MKSIGVLARYGQHQGQDSRRAGLFEHFCALVQSCAGCLDIVNQTNCSALEIVSGPDRKGAGDVPCPCGRACHRGLRLCSARSHKIRADAGSRVFELSRQDVRLVVATDQTPRPVQWNGYEKLYLFEKSASLESGIDEHAQNGVKLRLAILEGQYHGLQTLSVDAPPCDSVEMDFSALTIRAVARNQAELSRISPAPGAVVASRAEQELIPTISTEILVSFGDTCEAIHAYGGPEQVI